MPWKENKRLKLTILRESPKAQNMVIEFEVNEEHRENFHRTLEYALASCQTAGAEFKFDEIIDLETKEVVGLEVIMKGSQRLLSEAIKKELRGLQSNAVWTK